MYIANMRDGFSGEDALEIFIEETNQPPRYFFKLVLELREQKKLTNAEKHRKIQEQGKKKRERGEKKARGREEKSRGRGEVIKKARESRGKCGH